MASIDSNMRIGAWDLELANQEVSVESTLLKGGSDSDPGESTFSPDSRKEVPAADYGPDGKFRSIVKLRIKYEMQAKDDERWAMGTGWLVRPDVVVTAGHCAYDWRDSFGRAIHINAYIGYHGKSSIYSDPNVQSRRAKRIVTTEGWLKSKKNRINDVSFIQLNKAFKDVKPFEFSDTPLNGEEILGVVGYPGDKSLGEENGALMFGEFAKVQYDLDKPSQNPHMLQYKISTYAGQSGSPVLRGGINVSIGAHVYGGGEANAASVIGGKYGNPYAAYIEALRTAKPFTKKGVTYIDASSLPAPESGFGDEEEDFWGVLKSVASVATGTLPLLGPVGIPLSALTSVALGAAGKLCESSMGGPESGVSGSLKDQGFAERALLGEAALQALLELPFPASEAQESVFDTMRSVYKSLAPLVKMVAPKLLAPLMEGKLKTALVPPGEPSSGPRHALSIQENSIDAHIDPAMKNFMDGFLTPTVVVNGEEGFFGSLGDIISTGIRVGKPFITTAISGLGTLNSLLSGQESGMNNDASAKAFDTLSKRAIMGEAALQAMMTMDREGLEAEGFFDKMKQSLQLIGGQVMKYAPDVIDVVAPIVSSLLKSPESSLPQRGKKETKSTVKIPSVQSKPSLGNLLSSGKIPTLKGGSGFNPQMQAQLSFFKPMADPGTASMAKQLFKLEDQPNPPKRSASPDSNQDYALLE